MPRLNRLLHVARWIRSIAAANVIVLLYHRVADVQADPQSLCVTPHNFAEQMEVLRRVGNPVSLRDLNRGLQGRKIPRKGLVVSFDDGYADNLLNAKPILERSDIPASVFVAAGYAGSGREYWWDELEQLLLLPGTLPPHLDVYVSGAQIKWNLGDCASYSEECQRVHRSWTIAQKSVPTGRHALYLKLYGIMRPLPPAQRDELLEALRVWSARNFVAREGYRPMTPAELRDLTVSGLVELGAHTISHPVLSCLPLESQKKEINESKTLLEDIVNRPLTSFAYPYGGLDTYTADTIAAVRAAGFQSAFSTSVGLIRSDSDRFQLCRRVVYNWNGDVFASQIREWFLRG
jgi:peptidoglycan/xylan/chitin deacetylase (PgdA/CDA1 family)